MKTKHNILTKIFLILLIAAGWGSTAWAERFEPAFESSYDAGGHWYNITYWTSGNYYAAQGDGENLTYGSGYALSDKGLWQLVGSQSNFVLVTKSGLYAKWDGAKYVGTSTASEATSFSLIDMQGGRNDYWGIHRNDAGAGQVWNPQTQVKEYNNNDNNSSVKFVEPKLKTSSAPVGDAWAANTHWYTMRNVRAADQRSAGYIAADGDYIDADGNLKINVTTEPEGKGGQWAFVPTGDGSYYIYNRAKGTGYVMGTTNDQNDGNTRTKMYEMTDATANVTKTYTLGTNNDGFWICLTGTDKHLDDSKNIYLTVWDNPSGPKGSDGNRFILTEANPSVDLVATFDPAAGTTVNSLTTVTVDLSGEAYTVADATGIPVGTVQAMPVLRRRSDNVVVATATAVSSTTGGEPYTITFADVPTGEYTLVIPEGTFYAQVDGEWTSVSSMTANYDVKDFLGEVTLRFVDAGGNTVTGASVNYVPTSGDPVVLSSSTYDFDGAIYSKSSFKSSFDYALKNVVYDSESNTLTFTVAYNKWYTVKSNAGNRYLSSDYADAQGLKMQNGNNPAPTTYGGLWRMVETGTAARNSGGVNINMFNAKYYDTQVLGMGGDNWNQSNGNAARASMFATDAVPENYCQNFEQRLNGSNQTFRVDWTKENNSYFNVASGYLSLWNSGWGYGDANGVFTIEEVPILGTDVVVTVNTPAGVTVKYNTQCESASFLSAYTGQVQDIEMTNGMHFNFHNMPFLPSLFSFEPADVTKTLTATFDKDAQTLSLTVATDPNILQFSDAPENGAWAADTKWFTIHNNRNNKGYLSTQDSGEYLDDAGTLTIKNGTDASGNRGGLWAFVPQDGGGFNIYNNAYGPDFILGLTGNSGSARLNMYQKDAVPSGVSTLFTHGENSSRDGSASTAYYFRIGLTGTNHLNEQSGYAGTWAPTGANANKCESDQGSAFTVTAISDDDIAALQAYDVYKVETVGAIGYTGIDYTPAGNTFGKRSTAKNNDILILKEGSDIAVANFVAAPADYAIATATSSDDATHYYKHLTLKVRDALATDEYTIKVTDGTKGADLDVDAVDVRYVGEGVKNGEIIYVRPTAHPKATDFVVNGMDSKFVWGPVIDHTSKTITFDIRDRVTTFETGLYQLCLKGQSDIDGVNYYIDMFDQNVNTSSQYIYLAPSIYKNQGAKMKFTGVPRNAAEPSTYIYIKDNGNGTVNISASGQTEIQNIPYTFSNGEITFDGYSYIRYDTERPDMGEQWRDKHPIYDPMEQPALEQKSGRSTTFILHPTSMVEYDAYTLVFDGEYTSSTTVRYTKPTPTGVTTFTNNDMFVVDKGYTAFLSTDFLPNDARCTAVEIVEAPTETDLGVLKLTLSLPVREFTVKITGDAKNLATDRVVYNGISYENGAKVDIVGATVDATSIKTNVTDRFVWGPVIDEDFRTVTFDIRSIQETTLSQGWYQMQLVDLPNKQVYYNGDFQRPASLVDGVNGLPNIRDKGSYIYLQGSGHEIWAVETTGLSSTAKESVTYVYVQSMEGNNVKMLTQNGKYVNNNSQVSATEVTFPVLVVSENHSFRWNDRVLPWNNLGGKVCLGYAARAEVGSVEILFHPVAAKAYQVKGIGSNDVFYTGNAELKSNSRAQNNGFFFLAEGEDFETLSDGTTIDPSKFSIKRATINSITKGTDSATGLATLTFNISTFSDSYTNTVIHRQHAVYDLLEATDPSLHPGSNHIQPGEGMIDHPNADKFGGTKTVPNPEYNPNLDPSDPTPNLETITVDYNANDSRIQNTSVFVITQYVPKGRSTMCVLPFTMDNDPGNYVRQYQRIYDYLTECPLDAAIRGTQLDDYHLATNGHYTINGETGHVQPRNVHTFTLPSGKDEVWIAIDCSAFDDSEMLPNGNVLEPSLSARVIFHLISAEKMASNLKTSGDADEDWFEHAEYYVPNVKRGSDDHGNNADLLPLSMPYTNYWFHKTLGSTDPADLMPIAPETDVNMTTAANNVEVVIEGTTPTGEDINNYLEAGVFSGVYPGTTIESKYPNVNHFVYYKYKGSDLKRVIPEGSTAVIKVYAKDSSQDASPLYQIGKYTFNFQADAEPLAITSIVGNPNSTRSEEYFIKNRFSQVASLTFENKELSFKSVRGMSGVQNAAQTYAFPIDFSRTSYAYNSAYQFGTYSVSRRGYGIQFQPVALYEKNIKNPASTQISMTDDYFFYIDAAEAPGKVASVPLDGTLCTGSRLYCYGWMSSDNLHTRAGGAVVLNFIGRDADGTPHVLASYLSGNVSDVAYDEDGTAMRSLAYGRTPSWHEANWGDDRATLLGAWQQIGFSFSLDRTYEGGYELEIINNAYSTGGGDYVLDDFRVYVAPAKPTVEFNAPVCFDHVPHMKVTLPREAIENNHVDAEGFVPVSYCFVDKEKYYEKLTALAGDAAPTDAQYNEAFNYALLGNGTVTDGALDSDGKPESIRSFWNMKAAYTDAAYDSYKDYNFGKIISGDSDYPIDGVYRQISGASHNIVFSMPIRNSEGWEDNREYIIFFRHGHVTSGFQTAGTGYYNIHVLDCQSSDVFKMSPSLRVNSDMAELATDPPSACAGQVATISADMFGYGPINKVELPHMMYDWWIGYGKVNETDPVEAANVHNFAQLQYGGVYLLNALDNFRAFYPKANEVESSEPQSGEVDGLGHVDYTQADKDCILHFLEPNENGRVPLVLGSRIINIHMLERDAVEENGKKYIYCTIVPITPYVAYDGNDDVIFCPDPQQFKILIDQKAPHMFDGFTALHDDYPASMDNVPVRIGLRQIEAVRLDAKGNMGTHHLRVPLRGVELANTGKPCPIIKNRHKKHTAEESYNDYLTLVYTDDPLYADRMIVGVDELGNMDLLKVGRLQAYNANVGKTNASHSEIGFARDFQPREGYVYTLKLWYEENTDGIEDTFVPCPGSLIFDLKIVPEYAQWTAAKDNTDWTNDRNWARADRDVLHADNATSTLVDKSNAAHPYAAYNDNATNYSGDARYKSDVDASAHVFTPMYFTNVLMHDAGLRAPVIYTHTAPVANTSFLGGLVPETATKFIEYDMLATPISETGSWNSGKTMTPLALAQRYGNYSTNFGCELFWSNVCDGLTFEPGTAMYDAQHLLYNRAWVEYELQTGRWYTLASPLQDTYAGEWYSPEDGGRQLTPHFYAIKYNEALNDRFNPAYYQRSWDKAGEAWIYRMDGDNGTYLGFEHDYENASTVRVQKPTYLNWSYVYNDVTVPYSNGGFSVNVRYTDQGTDATDGKALVRMPKDDDSYLYYQSEASAAVGNTNGQNPDGSNTDAGVARPNGVASGDYTQITRSTATHHRLMSDMLRSGSTINQSIVNASASNPYYLIGNPLMAPLDMDKFFQENQQFVDHKDEQSPNGDGRKYWIMTDGLQDVSMKVNGNWISTSGAAGVVAPLQGFFVRVESGDDGKALAPSPNGMQVKYTAEMQKKDFTADVPAPSLRAPRRSDAQPGIFRITATNDSQLESNAVVYFSEQASNAYNTAEDAETLLDGNIADKVSTVFTAADEQALSINSMSTTVSMIPVGVIAPKDDTRTTLSFTGLSSLEAVMEGTPHIYDADDDTFMVLDEDTKLTVTGTSVGRYFIVTGTTLPFVDEEAAADDETDGHIYNLNGIRIATPQHGTVTIHGSRKEYNK